MKVLTIKKGKKKSLSTKESWIALCFILPPLLGFMIFTLAPLCASIVFSFTDFNPLMFTTKFVKFKNYIDIFTHQVYSVAFGESIVNTLFLLLGMPIRLAISCALAGIITSKAVKFSKFFKIVFYLPAISSAVALGIIWRYIFNGEYGLINYIFGTEIYWIGSDPWLVKIAIIIKNVWAGIGSTMIMFVAGMLGISKDYYEAADIDGASTLRKFFSITIPMLAPITLYLVTMGMINGLQNYADAQVFAQGNAGAKTIVYFIWERGIDNYRYGLASAAGLILAVSIMIITAVQFKFSNKWINEV